MEEKTGEKTGVQETSVPRESTEAVPTVDSRAEEFRRRPTWRGWVLSILMAIVLSVTATLLLGGYGAGHSCCSTMDAGK